MIEGKPGTTATRLYWALSTRHPPTSSQQPGASSPPFSY